MTGNSLRLEKQSVRYSDATDSFDHVHNDNSHGKAHLSLHHVQATVSECLSCVATSSMNNAAADACRAGDAATVPK